MAQNSELVQAASQLQLLTEHLLSFYELNAGVSTKLNGVNIIEIEVADSDLTSLFTANDATLLKSMQSIIVAISKTRWPDKGLIIHLDVGGYRAQQKAELISKAEEFIYRAIETNSEVEIPGLNSLERLIIHQYIADGYSTKLKTESRGEGQSRAIYVKPV